MSAAAGAPASGRAFAAIDAPGFRRGYARFLAHVVRAAGRRRIVFTVLLLLLAGASEGAGLMLLLPLLRLGAGGALPEDGLGHFLAPRLTALGLPLTMPTLLGLLMAIIALRSLLEWGRDMMAADVQVRFVAALRARTMAAVAGASWHFLGRQSNAHLHAILCRDVEALRQSAVYSLILAAQAVLLLSNLGVALAIAPVLAGYALLLGVVLAWVARRLVRHAQACGRRFERHQRRMQAEVADFLNGLKLVKSMSVEHQHVQAFHASADHLHEATQTFKTSGATLRALLQLGGAAAVSALLLLGQGRHGVAFAEMIVLALVFVRVVPVLRDIYNGLQIMANTLPAYGEIAAVTAQCEDHAESAPQVCAPLVLRQHLVLDALRFSYHGAARAAVDGVSATIAAGSMVALVGASGAGKTTLADMILGLLQPDSGTLRVDGLAIGVDQVHAWRHAVAYVPQDPFFLNASIRENLAWTTPAASEAAMRQALAQAGALDFVSRRQGGLDAIIGDHGRQLSGGERQRLALARALLRQPSVLVLDEPTSALDPDSARQVYAAIAGLRGQMTVIVIAHDLDKVRSADQVLVLAQGQLVEQGSWHALAYTGARRADA